jgi:hypothetical protein
MMGIGSLFGLSLGLSVLVEVVRMLNVGKKGKPAERWLGSLRSPGASMATGSGSGAGEPLGFDSWTNCNGRNGWVGEPTCSLGAPVRVRPTASAGVSTRFRGIISGLDYGN